MRSDCHILENFLRILPKGAYHVFEFRHRSWLNDDVFNILPCYNTGFCIYDMQGYSTPVIATTDFAYVRFHGSLRFYGGYYSDEELKYWAWKAASLKVKAVYAYFNNDAEGFEIKNALALRKCIETHLLD